METDDVASATSQEQMMMTLPEFYGAFNVDMIVHSSGYAPRHFQLDNPHHLFRSSSVDGNISFTRGVLLRGSPEKRNCSSMAAMREMIFRMAVMQPIHIDLDSVKPPRRRNVKISKDPQSVAARRRRERISERIRILQRLVPGGTKMDTASMLDEAIHYVNFLKTQVQSLQKAAANRPPALEGMHGVPVATMCDGNYGPPVGKGGYQQHFHGEGGANTLI